jgi:hypothetical protein
MSGIFLGKGITTSSAMRREAAPMEWIPFADVEFAECQHGYYFVYKKFDHLGVGCWFADYEERDNSPESREERFRLRGLSSIQEARLECEMARRPLNMRECVLAVFLARSLASSTIGKDVLVTGSWNNLATFGLRAEQEAAPRRTISITTAIRLKCFRPQTTN